MKSLPRILLVALALATSACRQPLAIQGEGDIIELNRGERGCALEEFRAGWSRCAVNEVNDTESLIYRALPRAGWRFSHWDGFCARDSLGDDCHKNYDRAWIQWWDETYPDEELAPLTAVFTPDDGAPAAQSYIASRFGAVGKVGFAALLDMLFAQDGSYRITVLQASTRGNFDRSPASFRRQPDSLLLAGPTPGTLLASGAATAAGDFLTLVDTDTSDGELSVSYLMAEQAQAQQAAFNGTYYCGHILSNGQALYFRATVNGRGSGSLFILRNRLNGANQASISYSVSEDGTTTVDYAGIRLAGSLSPDGGVFTATQVASSLQGAAICVRASGNKMVSNVAGSYYGAWISTQPVSGVTELTLDSRGQTTETVLRDSLGGRGYSLGQNFMLVKGSGEIETRDANGAVSPDGRVMFIVQTDPGRFPTLIVYVRKT